MAPPIFPFSSFDLPPQRHGAVFFDGIRFGAAAGGNRLDGFEHVFDALHAGIIPMFAVFAGDADHGEVWIVGTVREPGLICLAPETAGFVGVAEDFGFAAQNDGVFPAVLSAHVDFGIFLEFIDFDAARIGEENDGAAWLDFGDGHGAGVELAVWIDGGQDGGVEFGEDFKEFFALGWF